MPSDRLLVVLNEGPLNSGTIDVQMIDRFYSAGVGWRIEAEPAGPDRVGLGGVRGGAAATGVFRCVGATTCPSPVWPPCSSDQPTASEPGQT